MPASYIPEGYRLLIADDNGKTFGVDLESLVYFDNNVTPTALGAIGFSNSLFKIDDAQAINYLRSSNGMRFYNQDGNIYYYSDKPKWSKQSYVFNGLISSIITSSNWNNWLYVKDKAKPLFISDMNSLAKSITDKAGTTGKKSITELKGLVDNLKTTFTGQEKTVTPSKTSQVITPDTSYDGLSKVTVNPIPTDYIIPSGTLEVTENGTKDVTNYKSVNVNVPTPEPTYWDGSYTLSGLGYTVTLEVTSGNYIDSDFEYSIDNGTTWNKFTVGTTTLENVNTITFKAISVAYGLCVGTTSGGNDVLYMLVSGNPPYEVPITENSVLYVSSVSGSGGAD